jgi:hypothetical protein
MEDPAPELKVELSWHYSRPSWYRPVSNHLLSSHALVV